MRQSLAISGLALAVVAGCQTAPPPADPAAPPPQGGPHEKLEDCAATVGISGEFETVTYYQGGSATVSVVPGPGVSSDQADAVNQCLAGAA